MGILPLTVRPRGFQAQLLVAHEEFLLQFGGTMAQDYVSPQEALWTFDVSSCTWRQQFPSGVMPEPVTARGLAVANGRAYLLSFPLEREGSHGHLALAPPASCRRHTPTCFGGTTQGLEPKLHLCPDDPNQWQAATSIQCIRQQPVAPGLEALDLSCARFNIAANVTNMFTDELFTDARVVVEGRVWHVHRAMLAPASPILKDASHVVCNCFKELLDEDGLEQLDEHLASYTAAQVVHQPLCGAHMPACAEMSLCPSQSERVDKGCLVGVHCADAAIQTCPGGIHCADAATQTNGGSLRKDTAQSGRGLLAGNAESAQETMLRNSQPTTVDGRPAVVIAHGAETPNSPVPQKDVMEAPGGSATGLLPSTNSPQDEAQVLHEQPNEDAPVLQVDILLRLQVAHLTGPQPTLGSLWTVTAASA
ncbi:TPA: hypothetical protein ACH3X3_001072 [Trebouxia sp. C0006]